MQKKKVYVAYRFNDTDAGKVLSNIGTAHRIAYGLICEGYIPYIPHWDFLLATMFGREIPKKFYYENSMEWLKVCDRICVVEDGKPYSSGVEEEIRLAESLGLTFMYRRVDV